MALAVLPAATAAPLKMPFEFEQIFDLDDESLWEDYTFDFEKTFADGNKRGEDGKCTPPPVI